jgi:hypothetical protein
MDLVIIFIAFFLITYILYYFLLIRKSKKYDPNKLPQEVLFLKRRYNLNLEKINYRKLVKTLALVNSLIMAFTVVIVGFVKHFLLQFLLAFLILFPLIYITYSIIGKHYEKIGRDK